MQYEFYIIDVNDADALVINYKANDNDRWWTAVVDAGNVGDSDKVKKLVRHIENGHCYIDYAFCTHPDKDHKGGFFDLLTDDGITISNFCLLRPDDAVRNDCARLQYNDQSQLLNTAKALYNHPTDNTRNESAAPENLPVAKKMAESVICLPMHHALSEEDINRVLEIIVR